MSAAPDQSANIDLFHIGTRVTSHRRGNVVGIVKTEPFDDPFNGDRRWWVWVDIHPEGKRHVPQGPTGSRHLGALELTTVRLSPPWRIEQ